MKLKKPTPGATRALLTRQKEGGRSHSGAAKLAPTVSACVGLLAGSLFPWIIRMDKDRDVSQTAHCSTPPPPQIPAAVVPLVTERFCREQRFWRSDWSERREKRIHASGRGYVLCASATMTFSSSVPRVTCASPRGPTAQFSAAALKRSDPKL